MILEAVVTLRATTTKGAAEAATGQAIPTMMTRMRAKSLTTVTEAVRAMANKVDTVLTEEALAVAMEVAAVTTTSRWLLLIKGKRHEDNVKCMRRLSKRNFEQIHDEIFRAVPESFDHSRAQDHYFPVWPGWQQRACCLLPCSPSSNRTSPFV